MPDIRTGLMCKKCRDWPKIELRLAKRRAWKQAIMGLSRGGGLADDDLLAALMRTEDPVILDKLEMPPPINMDIDKLFSMLGMK